MNTSPIPSEPLTASQIASLKSVFSGDIISKNESSYDESRKVWNGMIDKHPELIARCMNVNDVVQAVKFARKHSLPVAIRGGSHNVAGFATCDNGMVIDLSLMKSIKVDEAKKVARADPGLKWKEFDAATQAHGLAVTGGLISTTGISGFTLGGGIGWLVRKCGFTADNLIGAQVVTADGEIIDSSMEVNPDLFWGLRGGGGNFGIVTSFQYSLARIGTMVLGGLVLYSFKNAQQVLDRYANLVAQNPPDELTTLIAFITAPPAQFVPQEYQGKPAIALACCYCGDTSDGAEIVQPFRALGEPIVDLIQPMPYTVLQSMLDETAPAGLQNYWKSAYLRPIGKEFIEAAISRFKLVPSPLSAIHIHQLGGAIRRVGDNATAIGKRNAAYVSNIVSMWISPEESDKNVKWTKDTFDAFAKFSEEGAYVNFLGEDGSDRVRAAYGEGKYRRLSQLKRKYDPTNFFHLNQNIRPEPSKSKR
ncbi:MAG: FAD-binding oxidoreductase [Nitrososphaera sp.]